MVCIAVLTYTCMDRDQCTDRERETSPSYVVNMSAFSRRSLALMYSYLIPYIVYIREQREEEKKQGFSNIDDRAFSLLLPIMRPYIYVWLQLSHDVFFLPSIFHLLYK